MIAAPKQDLMGRLAAEEFYLGLRVSDDGRQIIGIRQMIYTWAIFAGVDEGGYEDQWCYESGALAAIALARWSGNIGTEPDGWIRHPKSKRRRPGGDATQERVEP
jgi:hypothetical protein